MAFLLTRSSRSFLFVDVNENLPIGDTNPEDTDPDVVLEDIGDLVEEDSGIDEKAGEPDQTPVAGAVEEEYAGPKELIIDGELSAEEKIMLEAMGVREIVYNEAERGDYSTGIRSVKSSHIAFVKGQGGQYMLYFHEEVDPRRMKEKTNDLREIIIQPSGSPDGFPKIIGNIKAEKCGFFINEGALAKKGLDGLDTSCTNPLKYAYSEDGRVMECVIEDISPEIIKERVLEGSAGEILVDVYGGISKLTVGEIKTIKDVLVN